jgi:PAS domain S-box-containing protein
MSVTGSYDPYLVALSFAVACFASYTALDLGTRIRASSGWSRRAWLATAAVAMGGGIWSMHFIAMLAFVMPMPVTYDVGLTVLSLVVAIAVTGVGFYEMGTRQATILQLALSGQFMGIGIVAMHYTGMAAMHMPAHLNYDLAYVGMSVVIAVGAAIAALWLAFRTAALWQRALAAVVMGFAISGMHYTGMAAAAFSTHSGMGGQAAVSLAPTPLALSIAGITFLILILALIASVFDRQFAVLAEREAVLLRESEEQFRKLYRDTPVPLHSLGPDDRIENASRAWLNLLGYAREEAIGRPLTDFMTPDSQRRYQQVAVPRLQRGDELHEAEYQFLNRSGEIVDVLLSARVDLSPGKPARTLGGMIDITARKRAAEALKQAHRMEAIGQLTGGVAHDFNNLLMVINGAADKLKRTIVDATARKSLDMIATAVKRGQNLTGHLLSFARRQTLESTVVDLAKMLPRVSEMLRRSLRGDIEIKAWAQEAPCRVRVDAGELELALLNLAVNAKDAMPDGGVLTVSIHSVQLAGELETDGLQGPFVAVELTDTGIGIPPEIMPRLFEPFFTTKGAGKGTGLGLSQVYGFAKQSGGTATIRSVPGHGTTVCLYLPATDDPAQAEHDHAPAASEHGSDRDADRGMVLLVEDSADVAAVSKEILEQLGYAVEHATNGSDALHKLQGQDSYALVFSDVLMPGSVSGIELARIVREQHPEVPVLLTTAFSERAEEAVRAGLSIVQKPYDAGALSKAIANVRSQARDAEPVG